jgi:uncharacterized membrane protein YhaH (DUF805 family)
MSDLVREASNGTGRKGGGSWLDGRANRKEYWLFVGPLFVVGTILAALGQPWAQYATGLGIFLLMIRRLHDLGRSGFLAPLINVAIGVLSFAAKLMLPGGLGELIVGLIAIGVLIALGAWPGQPHNNAYGPPPGKRKSGVAEVFS